MAIVSKHHEPFESARAAEIIAAGADREGPLLPILHDLMQVFGHVPHDAVGLIADRLNLTRAEVHGVISFYHDFRDRPAPPHVIKLCRAEACQARGVEALAAHLEQAAARRPDVAVETVYCLGLCAIGPSALVDGRPVARLDPARVDRLLAGAL